MLLFCVRHGQSEFNAEGRIQGQFDTPLSDLGRLQAKAVAAALLRNGITALYASPLSRARETAEFVSQSLELPIQFDDRLKELNAGVFQQKIWSEIEEQYPEPAARWKTKDPDYAMPGGESRRQLMARGVEALDAIRRSGVERACVVAHGGLLVAAIKGFLGLPPEVAPFDLFNCSVSRVAWHGDDFKLVTLNEVDHLRALDTSSTITLGMQL